MRSQATRAPSASRSAAVRAWPSPASAAAPGSAASAASERSARRARPAGRRPAPGFGDLGARRHVGEGEPGHDETPSRATAILVITDETVAFSRRILLRHEVERPHERDRRRRRGSLSATAAPFFACAREAPSAPSAPWAPWAPSARGRTRSSCAPSSPSRAWASPRSARVLGRRPAAPAEEVGELDLLLEVDRHD